MKFERGNTKGVSGKVLVELILVTPLLIMIPGAVFEISRFIRLNQVASVYSQEAATQIYRQCGDYSVYIEDPNDPKKLKFDSTESTKKTDDCVKKHQGDIQTSLSLKLPDSKLITTVYRYNYGGTTTGNLSQVAISPTPIPGSHDDFLKSRVSADGATLKRKDGNASPVVIVTAANAQRRERIIVAEVTYSYRPVIGFFRMFFGTTALQTNGVYRETTVL